MRHQCGLSLRETVELIIHELNLFKGEVSLIFGVISKSQTKRFCINKCNSFAGNYYHHCVLNCPD